MNQRSIACKGLVICMVLFCACMQWSPLVDLDYVWINGHEHYVGADNPHQLGNVVLPALPQPVETFLERFGDQLLMLSVTQSTERLLPATTLRLWVPSCL